MWHISCKHSIIYRSFSIRIKNICHDYTKTSSRVVLTYDIITMLCGNWLSVKCNAITSFGWTPPAWLLTCSFAVYSGLYRENWYSMANIYFAYNRLIKITTGAKSEYCTTRWQHISFGVVNSRIDSAGFYTKGRPLVKSNSICPSDKLCWQPGCPVLNINIQGNFCISQGNGSSDNLPENLV